MRMERLAGIGWIALLAAGGAQGQEQMVAIDLGNSQLAPFAILAQAHATVERIYAGVGVKVKCCSAISMQFDTGVAPQVHPAAMGYAVPYGKTGMHVHVFLNRVLSTESRRLTGALLGHVIAHELGHVLESSSRHADKGVMKARWDNVDFDQMLIRPLPISAGEVEEGSQQLGKPTALTGKEFRWRDFRRSFHTLAHGHQVADHLVAGFRNCTDESRAAGVIPKALPQVSQALHQRFVSHRSVRPQLEHQLFLGNHAITMGEQIHQQVESFHPGMQHAVWPAKGARFQINFDAVDAKQSGSGNHRIG